MLRRTKNQEIDGKPIIVLPARTIENIPCDFDEDERAFYSAVEARTNLAMNKFIERGTVMTNYTSVLVLLLRLRQGAGSGRCCESPILRGRLIEILLACDHPALLSKDFTKDLDALDSKPQAPPGDDDEDEKKEVDELAGLLGGLGIAKSNQCTICMSEYVNMILL